MHNLRLGRSRSSQSVYGSGLHFNGVVYNMEGMGIAFQSMEHSYILHRAFGRWREAYKGHIKSLKGQVFLIWKHLVGEYLI